ncbi:Nif11-like leader peptide family RiPP precursor [Dulcicalothrix desertica]|nr:Nif11-like leader peptide family RiPP precursor [Dulcicalothrix desertica]TWH51324.1 putative ribosomally synthesized peptide with nif11-like leader [Dulcicalothrix desertica PCC 7102]
MSTSNMEKFTSAVISDAALRDRLAAADSLDSATEMAMQIAQEKGYNFSVEEMKAKLEEIYNANQSGELSDELLEAVAGGKSSPRIGGGISVGPGGISVGGSFSGW